MISSTSWRRRIALAAAALAVVLAYWPGLSGSWFFDDYANIVYNPSVQPARLGAAELLAAALSSPASDFGRPLASLSFVANHAINGMDPFGWKLTNLAIHLLNAWLVFVLAHALLSTPARDRDPSGTLLTALLIALGWAVLPINLAPVLMVVQRMESLANLFVLAGLIGYVRGRQHMLADGAGFARCTASLLFATAFGLLAKETAALLPLYAVLIECFLFRFRHHAGGQDRRLGGLFVGVLVLPMLVGGAWLLPKLLQPETWAMRDFTMATRLLSEARVVVDYIGWTLLPLPQALSFYHDDFVISRGLLSPWTTLASLLFLVLLAALLPWLARRSPVTALGIALFLGAHLLTGTVLPLELIFEHRNYFASFGLLLALVPWLSRPALPFMSARRIILGVLLLWWIGLTAWTAHAWGEPLRLARELAVRAPDSPRAQFGYGRELLTRSGYDLQSPLLAQAFSVLDQAGAMPGSSILPEETLILTYSLMQKTAETRWWDRLIAKLAAKAPSSEDVDALAALVGCARDRRCRLPHASMQAALDAAESHPRRNAKLLTIRGDWAWSVLGDRTTGERYASAAVDAQPNDADARITLIRMNIVIGNLAKAQQQLDALRERFGQLKNQQMELQQLIDARTPSPNP